MNCEKCGKLLDASGFCSDCGVTMNTSRTASDFIANAGLLTIIAAAFSLTAGAIGFISYRTYLEYYTYYGVDAPNAFAFLLIAGFAIGAAVLGFLSSSYAFKKKRFALTLIGPAVMVVSGLFVFIVETVYSLGYSDGLSVAAIPAMVLSFAALVMLFNSKSAFVDDNADSDAELESPEASDAESNIVEQPIEEPAA